MRKQNYFLYLLIRGIGLFLGILLINVLFSVFIIQNTEPKTLGWLLLGNVPLFGISLLAFLSNGWSKNHFTQTIPPSERSLSIKDTKNDLHLVLILVLFLLTISGFFIARIQPSTPGSIPAIASMRTALEEPNQFAQDWQEDAFLYKATLYFHNNPYRYLEAEYFSPKKPATYLVVWIDHEGNMYRETYSHRGDTVYPITETDWEIDSQEALRVFSTDDDLRFCINKADNSSPLFEDEKLLRLRNSPENNFVLWEIYFSDCHYYKEKEFAINALTGEKVFFTGKEN